MATSPFQRDRHIKYFLRCTKTFLPNAYTSSDSNRMLLAFLSLAGLDLLGVLHTSTSDSDRCGYIEWIYHCQLPTGGFRGFTGTDFRIEKENTSPTSSYPPRTAENEVWDPANVPATFFALVILLILGDDLSRVNREECLRWLPKMQREDGSFGEVLGANGEIQGGRDLRFCCCAAGTRYILRGRRTPGFDPGTRTDLEDVPDIDVEKLTQFIEACQSYDGGMAEGPFCESHSGLTYCAVGALTFLARSSDKFKPGKLLTPGTIEFEALVRWLVARQTTELGDEDSDEEDDDNDVERLRKLQHSIQGLTLEDKVLGLPDLQPPDPSDLRCAGFNGRCNKYADTCYSFWNTATLAMMDRLHLVDAESNRRFLLEKTQHIIGGFGKGVGEPPDLLHSYFGLVSLAFQGEAGLGSVDPALCASHRAVEQLKSVTWWSK